MGDAIVLASGSATRRQLFAAAHVPVEAVAPRIDEAALRAGLAAEGASPRDIADALAEMKARKVADKRPDALVIGCDQVLEFEGAALGKADTLADLRAQMVALRGKRHALLSAAVIYDAGQPVWRHVGVARMTMRDFSDVYLDAYLDRNGADLLDSVGGYRIEGEGVRLFSRVDGDQFAVLGLPMLEILSYLALRGAIAA